jgi:deazaflavin-dependent oxidoreductase (nitroreductase family)
MTNSSKAERRIQTMPAQKVTNVIVRGLLNTPGISAGIGRNLLTVYAVGRKTGRHYDVPVAYVRHEGKLLFGTPFGWARNLRDGEPVTIRLKGKKVLADVQVFTAEADVTRLYAVMCRANRNFAKFNKVRIGADGEPDAGDLRLAWADGARAFVLAPR